MRLLVMHDCRARVRSSSGQVHTTPLASEVVAGQDIATQGAPLLGVVQLAVLIGGCGALGHSKKYVWRLGVVAATQGNGQWVSKPSSTKETRIE